MGKRKVSRASGPSGPKDIDPADARLTMRTHEDIADDQEEYFMEQDKILLEYDGPSSKRARTDDRIDEFLEASDEEVFRDNDTESDEEYEELQKVAKAQAKKKKKSGNSDDEEEERAGEEEGDEGYWGDSRKEYYNADQIETEADALEEEAEAKRLQKKKLADMKEADFIFDEDEWAAPAEEAEEGAQTVTEELQDIKVTDDMDADERNRLLQARYPEFAPLVAEFESLQPQLTQLQKEAEGKPAKSLEVVRHWMLGCYIASLASYFAVLTSPSRDASEPTVSLSPVELRDHEVMETLVSCREAWHQVKDLKSTRPVATAMEIDSVDEDMSDVEEVKPVKKAKKKAEVNGDSKKKKKKAEKERLAKAKAVEESLADLKNLGSEPKRSKKARSAATAQRDNNSDFGEEDSLDARTAADKAANKKSLRFYTSQIVQKASKRADAGRDAGGDLDIPYRERLRDRAARLNAEAEARGKKSSKHGTELGGDEASSGDEAVAKQVRGEEDEYYDMVAHRTKAKKDDKSARKEALAQAKITDRVVEVSTIGEDGKRKINYQIEKNKGLAPKRKKEVRNPRVKKRMKYEEKQKKLKSMKATYQGGEGRGGYQGETTGIKTGLVKSVKL